MIGTTRIGSSGSSPADRGDVTETHVAWETTKGLNEMPSPLYYRGRIYVIADGGRLTIFRPTTGERILDRQPIGANGQYVASPIAANGFVYLVNERGTFTVLRAEDRLAVVATTSLEESVRGTPALVGTRLYVRTHAHLYAFAQ